MSKNDFLSALDRALAGVPAEDAKRAREYYSEIIDDRMEDGMEEEAAVQALGPLPEIVAKILSDIPLARLVKKKIVPQRALHAWEILLLILGSPVWLPLLAAAAVVLLTFYLLVWVGILLLYSIDLTFVAVALAGVVAVAVFLWRGDVGAGLVYFGVALGSAGLAIFMFLGSNQGAKMLLRWSKKCMLGMKSNLIRKGEAQ